MSARLENEVYRCAHRYRSGHRGFLRTIAGEDEKVLCMVRGMSMSVAPSSMTSCIDPTLVFLAYPTWRKRLSSRLWVNDRSARSLSQRANTVLEGEWIVVGGIWYQSVNAICGAWQTRTSIIDKSVAVVFANSACKGLFILLLLLHLVIPSSSINGVVVTWVVAIDPPGVRFPLNAFVFHPAGSSPPSQRLPRSLVQPSTQTPSGT